MQRITPLSLIVVIGGWLAVAGCGRPSEPQVVAAPAPGATTTAAADVAAPPPASGPSLPKLLDLGAKSCIPCKMMAPILDDLKVNYADQFETVFIDVWENREAGLKHGVRSIPTQIFFDAEGQELFRHVGFLSKEDILAKWKELGYPFEPPAEG